MSSDFVNKLNELGLTLPAAPSPSASYVPFARVGNLLYISGQVSKKDGKEDYVGKLGLNLSVQEGQAAAKSCALSLLAHLDVALAGDMRRVRRCVRLGGFVNATPEFGEHPQVINGASDLMLAVLGDAGKHTRAAVGVASLPRGVAVEVDAIFEITD